MQLPIAVAVAVTTSLVALFIIGFFIFRCLKKPTARDNKTQEPQNTCLHFSIEEIRTATKNFNDSLIIGNGGFGNVYKGNIERCHSQHPHCGWSEKWVAKVSDFGLSKDGPNGSTHVTTDVKGSIGYLDPEYYVSQWLSQKSDVYSFGVVLLEVLCGRPPIKSRVDKHEESLVGWFKKCFDEGKVDRTVDPVLKGTIKIKCLMKFVEVALSCLHHHGKQRPLMKDVVMGLECAWNLQHGGAHVKGKGKIRKSEEEKEIEVESFGRVEECSSSKDTTITSTCSEEEQALVMVGGIHESLDIP
ncbi:hypothetical protein P8452_33677 [Trifolium repens]|nr:hypothetical protein P8452_33677 [Trifolium repens]